jgi:folate-dependent phosphoribosylglycinamide formyltransferase PurN
MKTVIFTQNTMASIVATRTVLQKNAPHVKALVLASQFRGPSFLEQLYSAWQLTKKTCPSFLFYKIIESKFYPLLLKFHKIFNTRQAWEKDALTIEDLAKKYGIPLIVTEDLGGERFLGKIKEINPDFIFCQIAQILRQTSFEALGNRFLNSHGSWLPQYRGAAQYFWYLLNEDAEYGVTLHFMTPKLDTGDIVLQKRTPFPASWTAYRLHYCLSVGFGEIFNEFLAKFSCREEVRSHPQDSATATVTRLPTRGDMKQFRRKGKRMITIRDFFSII